VNSTHVCMIGTVIEVLSIVCIIHMFGVKDIVLLLDSSWWWSNKQCSDPNSLKGNKNQPLGLTLC